MNFVKDKLQKSIKRFMEVESSSSILLAIATLVALVFANTPLNSSYIKLLNLKLFSVSILHWINDGLMVIFFFLVGLEIKKELIAGELRTFKKAALPIVAAIGGMIAPAMIYSSLNQASSASHGWGIPMATDIAFAAGLLSLFGKRVPFALKIFLLAVAIVDDLGAILVIAIFYTNQIKWLGLTVALISIAVIALFKHLKFNRPLYYLPLGIVMWAAVFYSGVHATIAGVILGLLTPISFKSTVGNIEKPLETLIDYLHIPVSFLIMPIFALANAGISINPDSIAIALSSKVFWGIFLGLTIGKPLGIFLFSTIACKVGVASLPDEMKWQHVLALGCVAGIGFTMSLFISNLALSGDLEIHSKLGILMASVGSGLIGCIALKILLPQKNRST